MYFQFTCTQFFQHTGTHSLSLGLNMILENVVALIKLFVVSHNIHLLHISMIFVRFMDILFDAANAVCILVGDSHI